jgi:hypothetical protein
VNGPAFAVEFFSIRRQQVEAEDIKSAGSQVRGNAFEVLSSVCFGEQVPKGVDEAVHEFERAGSTETAHVLLQNHCIQAIPSNPLADCANTVGIEVEGADRPATAGKFEYLATATAANFQRSWGGQTEIQFGRR